MPKKLFSNWSIDVAQTTQHVAQQKCYTKLLKNKFNSYVA